METKQTRKWGGAIILMIIGLVAGYGASYIYQPQTDRLSVRTNDLENQLTTVQNQLSELQNLDKARDSIQVVRWFAECPDRTTCDYQVRVTNNNNFDVTSKQILISLVDNSGNQVSTGSYTTPVIIRPGNSVTITVNVTYPINTAGVSTEVTLVTPYGDVVIGTI